MNSGGRELVVVLTMMGVILVFAFIAVGVFLSVLRREKKGKD